GLEISLGNALLLEEFLVVHRDWRIRPFVHPDLLSGAGLYEQAADKHLFELFRRQGRFRRTLVARAGHGQQQHQDKQLPHRVNVARMPRTDGSTFPSAWAKRPFTQVRSTRERKRCPSKGDQPQVYSRLSVVTVQGASRATSTRSA